MEKSIKIFISYSHEDEPLRRKLETHLTSLLRGGLVTIWHDRNISAGREWAREIDVFLNTAHIVLLLVSSDFLASEYCYSIEMRQAMAKHDAGKVRVIPIILRHVNWKITPFGQLQPLPTNAEPVISSYWHTLDQALLDITNGIQRVVEELRTGQTRVISALPNSKPSQIIVPARLPRPATLIGREAELTKLMNQLRAGEVSGIYALNGMGGVGKTALAAEAVGRLFQEHDIFPGGAAWIFCEGLEGEEGLKVVWRQVAMAMRLEYVMKMTDSDEQRLALTMALTQFPRFLLALDNIEPKLEAEVLLETLSVPGHTSLLLTARQVLVPEKLTSVALHPLPSSDAIQLFFQRLRQVDDARPTAEDEIWIPQIIATLGGLPLAVELVAAYAGVQQLPLDHIIREIEQDKLEATSLNFDSKRALRSRFNRSWIVLLPQEQALFANLVLLSGTVFSRKSVVKLAQYLNSTDEASAKQMTAKLVTYALVEPVGRIYMRLHPLLRDYAQEKIEEILRDLKQKDDFYFWHYRETIMRLQDNYPDSYEGLSGIEADQMWDFHQEVQRRRLTTQTSMDIPTLSIHALQLLELGTHLREAEQRDRGRERLLECLAAGKAAMDSRVMALCHQQLALLDESEGNYIGAIEHCSEALRLFQKNQSSGAEQTRLLLDRVRARMSPDLLEQLRARTDQSSAFASQNKPRGWIFIKQGKEMGRTYEIHNKPLRLGRSPESDIVLEGALASRKHATLLPLNENNCGLKDEGSTNGTQINDFPINKQQVYILQSGDNICIGETLLIFTKSDF